MNKEESNEESIHREDVAAKALLNDSENLHNALRNRSELEEIPVNDCNEDNSSLKTASSGHEREQLNVQLDMQKNVASNKIVTQPIQAELNTSDETSTEHICNNKDIYISSAEKYTQENFNKVDNKNNIKECSKHMENIFDTMQIERIKQSKESFTTVTVLLAPMMAKTQFAVPVYRFHSELPSAQDCNTNYDTNKTSEYSVKNENNCQS